MKSLQEKLDEYGESTGCHHWNGWVRECMQHPDMVVDKYNQIVKEFKTEIDNQVDNSLVLLKEQVYSESNWIKNKGTYKRLIEGAVAGN